MKQHEDDKLTWRQRRNMQFSEDRFDLLDTIRDMIDDELDHRGVKPGGDPHHENLPPEQHSREPARRPTLWQRIVSLFAVCL